MNDKGYKPKGSKFIGVYQTTFGYKAVTTRHGRNIYIGHYKTERDAAIAFNDARTGLGDKGDEPWFNDIPELKEGDEKVPALKEFYDKIMDGLLELEADYREFGSESCGGVDSQEQLNRDADFKMRGMQTRMHAMEININRLNEEREEQEKINRSIGPAAKTKVEEPSPFGDPKVYL